MTPNPPVAAPVEERHVDSCRFIVEALDGLMAPARVRVLRDVASQLLANTEAAARADERQKAMETACRAVCRTCILEGPIDTPNGYYHLVFNLSTGQKTELEQCRADAIRRAFEEKGGDAK